MSFLFRQRLVRAARYGAYATLAIVAFAVAAVLVIPAFLDIPAVEREIQAKLSQSVHGKIAWEKLSIRLLPSPRGALSQVRVEIPEVASLRAERVDVHLRLLPLLRGHAEVASISLLKPEIRIEVAQPSAAKAKPQEEAPVDLAEVYRSTVDEIRGFAPEAVLEVEDANVDVRIPGMPPIQVSALDLYAHTESKGLELELTAASDSWSSLKLSAKVDFASLSASGRLDAADLKAQPWLDRFLVESPIDVVLPAANLRAQARTDGKANLECDFDLRAASMDILRGTARVQVPQVAIEGKLAASSREIAVRLSRAQLGASRLTAGSLRYLPQGNSLAGRAEFDLDLAQAMDGARRVVPEESAKALSALQPVSGRARGQASVDIGRAGWKAEINIRESDASIGIEGLPGPVKLASGTVNITGDAVRIGRAEVSLLDSRAAGSGTINYGGSIAAQAEFDLDLAQAMDSARRMLPEKAVKALRGFQPVAGRARGQAKMNVGRSGWSTEVEIRESDSSIGIEGLPGPVKVASGTVNITRDTVKVGRAEVSLLDARAIASATVRYGGPLRIEGAVSEGSIGKNVLAWAWKRADAPPHLALKAPVRVAVERAAWSPKQPLELKASASFDAGPSVAIDLSWTPEALDIRRAAIKDAKSDATLSLHLEKALLQGRFSGSLQSATMAAMLASATVPSGAWDGDLRVRFDLKQPERFAATGKLRGKSVDLAWLLARPVMIERVDLEADGDKLQIREAAVNWAGQHFALRGELSRAADGAPIIETQIESPGVVVDALLQRTEAKTPAAAEEKAKPAEDGPLWTLWPLPVRGHVAFRSKFIQYGERKAEPVAATLTLEENRAYLELQQVQLCGISFPLTAEARPNGVLTLDVRLAAQKQQLEYTAHCLTERGVQMDGEFDLNADFRTRGTQHELVSNLQGTIRAEARNGKVMKFAMLGNILSTQAVAGMFKEGEAKVDEKGFPYRSITAAGRFDKGRFILDESFFRSDIIGLAAKGSISLIDDEAKPYDADLTVLVAPLGSLDRLVRRIPVLGYVLGGALTSVPVRVSADIRNPRVVPLAPGAVVSELAGIFGRALKLPARMLPKPAPSTEP